MKTQRAPYTQAEYCLIPLTHKASPYVPPTHTDVRKTWQAYGWQPLKAKHDQTNR